MFPRTAPTLKNKRQLQPTITIRMNRSFEVQQSNRSRMNRVITCGILATAAAILFASCTRTHFRSTGPGGWTRDHNQHASLSDYKGKVIVLDFYATWCEPCRAETQRLVALQKQYGEKGLQVIGLNVGGEDDRDKIQQFAKDFGIQDTLGVPDVALDQSFLSD